MATPVGHGLAGYAVYKAFKPYGLQNRPLLAVFMALAPDLDFVPGFLSGAPALYHQSVTHSVGFALAISAAVAIIYRRKQQSFFPIFSLCFIAYLSHLIIDFFGPDGRLPYGQPLFWPASNGYLISPVSVFWGMHHAGSTYGSRSDWMMGIFSLHNLAAVAIEIGLIVPFVFLASSTGKFLSARRRSFAEDPSPIRGHERPMERLSQQTYREVENRRYFDRWSKHYDDGRISRWFQYTQELTIRLLDLKPDSKVLDVGCGTGHAVLRLASIVSAGKACGIDVSPGMVEKASSKVPDELKKIVEFVQASSEDIPYRNGQFNHVLCTNSFHHYPDPLQALREMRRVLKPGGQIVIFENAPDLSWYTWVWDRILRVAETGHVRYYASWEIGHMLAQAAFENVRLCYLGNEFLKHGKIFASIQVWSGKVPRDKEKK